MAGSLTSKPVLVDLETILSYALMEDIVDALWDAVGDGAQVPTTPAEVLANLGATTIGKDILQAADAAAVNALLGSSGLVKAIAVGTVTLTTNASTTVGISPPLNFVGTYSGDFTSTTVSVQLTPANSAAQSYVATNGPVYVNNILAGLGGLTFNLNYTATPSASEQFYVTAIGI